MTDTRAALRRLSILGPTFDAATLQWADLVGPEEIEAAVAEGQLEIDDVVRFVAPGLWSELAHELDTDPTTSFAVRVQVGRRAYDRLEYTEAVRQFREALRVQPRVSRADPSRGQLLVEQARALFRSGAIDEAWHACQEAAAVARATGDAALFADAATAIRGAGVANWTFAASQHLLCREALAMLGDSEPARSLRLRAQLACTNNPWVREGPGDGVASPAAAVALEADDAESKFLALEARHSAAISVTHVDERLDLADEAIVLGSSSLVDEYLAWGVLWRIDALYQLGRRIEMEAELINASALTTRMREPVWEWRLLNIRSSLATLDGRYAEASQLVQQALEKGQHIGLPNAGIVHLIASSRLAVLTGRGLAEIEHEVAAALKGAPFFARGWHALVLNALGRRDEVVVIWRALAPHLATLPRDAPEWLVAQTGHASLCVALGDRTAAAELYRLLLPFQALHAVASAETPSDGPVALSLGRLARLLGDDRAAREHLKAAIRMSEVMHAPPAAAEARAELDALGVASELSRREEEVAALVADGLSNREIATQLYLSERTVESHVSSALRKLNLSSRAALAAWQVRHSENIRKELRPDELRRRR